MSQGRRRLLGSLLALFVLPFLVFTNLHQLHTYYQYANSIFLVLAVALALWELAERYPTRVFAVAALIVVAGEVYTSHRAYLPDTILSVAEAPELSVSDYLRSKSLPGSVIVVIGSDWNPVLAYYSRRRAIYVPRWAKRERLEALLRDPARLTDGRPVCGVIDAPRGFEPAGCALWREFVASLSKRSTVARFGPYQVLLPRAPKTWSELITSDSLPSQSNSSTNWARFLPVGWRLNVLGTGAVGDLNNVIVGDSLVRRSGAPVLAKRGLVLHLTGWVANKPATTTPQELVLGLCGTTNWASRYIWTTRRVNSETPAEAKATPGAAFFDVLSTIPSDLPGDTYQTMLYFKRDGSLVPVNLWLRLRLAQR